jgi:predicted metalloprotease with PDZ domain
VPQLELDLREPHSQRLQARLRFTPRSTSLGLSLPRWTPGSYLLREYVGQLEGLQLHQQGVALAPRRVTPFRWELELESLAPLTVTYGVQATDLSVRTAHLNDEHGFLPLAALALQVDGQRWMPHGLQLLLPPGWQAFVPLPEQDEGGWLATDFDQLVDSPVEVGPHPCHRFEVAGVPHRWVGWGGDLAEQDGQWLADVDRVCRACCRLMGEPRPAADDYLFVLHLTESGYGGLEHDTSTVLQFGRRRLARPEGRRKLLQLVAHEYLHQWNVRRLRPSQLVPIDYDRAVVVPTLWFAEGITSYVDQLLPHAAGCCPAHEVLEDLAEDLGRYLASQGRFVQSLRASSEEAWVKLYRPHPHAANQQISYYLKGAVLGLVLDLHLRRHGSWLGAVLQDLWRSHGTSRRGYSDDDLLDAFALHAADLRTLVPHWLSSTEDPPLVQLLLSEVGLHLEPAQRTGVDLGCQVEQRTAGGLWVSRTSRGGPAQQAGLQVGDELIALGQERIRQHEDLNQLLASVVPGQALALLISREGLLRRYNLHPGPPRPERWQLRVDADAPPLVHQRREAWLQLRP